MAVQDLQRRIRHDTLQDFLSKTLSALFRAKHCCHFPQSFHPPIPILGMGIGSTACHFYQFPYMAGQKKPFKA